MTHQSDVPFLIDKFLKLLYCINVLKIISMIASLHYDFPTLIQLEVYMTLLSMREEYSHD